MPRPPPGGAIGCQQVINFEDVATCTYEAFLEETGLEALQAFLGRVAGYL